MAKPLTPEQKEKRREYNRKWRLANRDKRREYRRKWRLADPDRARAKRRKWRVENPDKSRASVQKWHRANPEKVSAGARRRHLANPEKYREKAKRQQEALKTIRKQALTGCVDRFTNERCFGRLQFDHVIGPKSFTVSNATVSPARLRAEIAKCEIRCEYHHAKVTAERLRLGLTKLTPQGWIRPADALPEPSWPVQLQLLK